MTGILSPFPFILLRSLSQTAGRAPAPASNTQNTCEQLQMSSWTISIGHCSAILWGRRTPCVWWHGHLGLDSTFQTELTTCDNAELHLSPQNSHSQEILTPHLCSFLRNDLPQRTILPTWLRSVWLSTLSHDPIQLGNDSLVYLWQGQMQNFLLVPESVDKARHRPFNSPLSVSWMINWDEAFGSLTYLQMMRPTRA